MQDRVSIISKTFELPSGELRTVEAPIPFTTRARAVFYVHIKSAQWDDARHESIYFLDPSAILQRGVERKDGVHSWYVGDSGGSSLVKAYTGKWNGGTRVLMCAGGQHKFMDAD